MNRDDIIRMAREVGYPLVEYEGEPYIPPLLAVLLGAVAAAEREACAKVCEDMDLHNNELRPEYQRGLLNAACAIRAKGQA